MNTGEALATPVKYDAPVKDLYEIGEIPPLGHVPANMYAWCIRQDRHGPPEDAMQLEVVPTWQIDSHEVLIYVMAAGVNYNGVWAALGTPVSTLDGHDSPHHIAGSDASGIVWAVGSKVTRWKVGWPPGSAQTRSAVRDTRSEVCATPCGDQIIPRTSPSASSGAPAISLRL